MSDQYYQFSLFTKMSFDASKIERYIFIRILSFRKRIPVKDEFADCSIYSTEWVIKQVYIGIAIYCSADESYN